MLKKYPHFVKLKLEKLSLKKYIGMQVINWDTHDFITVSIISKISIEKIYLQFLKIVIPSQYSTQYNINKL